MALRGASVTLHKLIIVICSSEYNGIFLYYNRINPDTQFIFRFVNQNGNSGSVRMI